MFSAIYMKIDLFILIIAGFVIYNIYTDGKFLKGLYSYKKYYQMTGIGLGAVFLFWLIRRQPDRARQLIVSSNEYLKYIPVDRHASSMLNPIFDFTNRIGGGGGGDEGGGGGIANLARNAILGMPFLKRDGHQQHAEKRVMMSGGVDATPYEGTPSGLAATMKKTKRSVSETKKKFVASRQDWKCGKCGCKLPAWFEVDHKIRLEHGGSNHIDNLVALCRDCHGEKTAMENL